jgi:hypothetical protein
MIWSIGATCQAATFNRAGLFVCRLFVGVGEAMFGTFIGCVYITATTNSPGQAMAFYLSLFYSKVDLARRVGIFISAGSVAGAL